MDLLDIVLLPYKKEILFYFLHMLSLYCSFVETITILLKNTQILQMLQQEET